MRLRLIFLIGCLFLSACSKPTTSQSSSVILTAPAGNQISVQVELAVTPQEQEKGLMFRQNLEPGKGMLFIFDRPKILGFWMKNTLIPLDILYFDTKGDFVSFREMEPCTADPCSTYSSFAEALYALEVPKGFANEHKVGIGWKMTVPSNQLTK